MFTSRTRRQAVWVRAALTAALVASGLSLVVAPSATAAVSDCTGVASVYGVLSDGRLTYSTINVPTNTGTKVLIGAGVGFVPKAMATLNFNTILVTSSSGTLYRVDVGTNSTSLTFTKTSIGTGWTHDKLAYDGSGHLFGTTASGTLLRYTVSGSKPTASSITNTTTIGTGFVLKTLTADAPDYLVATTSAGALLSYRITGANAWTRYELRSSTWQGFDILTSPGGGVLYGHNPAGALYGYHDANPTDGSGTDITSAGAVNTSGWTQVRLSAQPGAITCGAITYAMLTSMYGSRVGTQSTVVAGLPSLNAEMVRAGITTPARKAAFLATLLNESAFRYNIVQPGTDPYRGRGFIQLTSAANYSSAGSYFGIDLVNSPALAATLTYSAPIARWYWTVARPGLNAAADAHDMGQVDVYIAFFGSGDPNNAERLERCVDFKTAYRYLTGVTPSVTC